MNLLKTITSRRRFMQASGAAGAAVGAGHLGGLATLSTAEAAATAAGDGKTVVNKSICAQCPARCGIEVYTTNGRVHAIYGNPSTRSPTASCARRATSASTCFTTRTASRGR